MSDVAAQVVSGSLLGPSMSAEELRFIETWHPAGITLFGRNIPANHRHVRSLCEQIQEIYPKNLPALISIDQEGGRVRRIKDCSFDSGTPLDSEISNHKNLLNQIETSHKKVGQQLRNLGINVNFAPVVDLFSYNTDNSIGDRCWGRNSTDVTQRAGAALVGLQHAQIASCLKHFPGQGAATQDTHITGTAISLNRSELDAHIEPYIQLHNQTNMIMVSHSSYTALGEEPACFNTFLLQTILREHVGFKGVIVSDDLTMGAMKDKNPVEVAVRAISSGCDLLLVCQGLEHWQTLVHGLAEEAAKNPIFHTRLHEAAGKVQDLRHALSV